MADPILGRHLAEKEYFDDMRRNKKRAQILGAIVVVFMLCVGAAVLFYLF